MPIINGSKYSCEPCIRGHRASSCAHADRILIEVRKPGRPLESCGHSFNSCQCGKIAELLAVGPATLNQEYLTPVEEKQDIIPVQSLPSAPNLPKPKSRNRSSSKVNKRTRKSAGSSSTPALIDRGLGEVQSQHHHHHPNLQNVPSSTYATHSSPYGMSPSYAQPGSHSQPSASPYLPMREHYYDGTEAGYVHAADCVNRVGNVGVGAAPNAAYSGQQIVTSQYIVASPDSAWEAEPPQEG